MPAAMHAKAPVNIVSGSICTVLCPAYNAMLHVLQAMSLVADTFSMILNDLNLHNLFRAGAR